MPRTAHKRGLPRVRLLAVDVDGTLTVPGTSSIPASVITALMECISQGITLVPATGKKFSSIRHLCKTLDLHGPAIACNGALVHEASTGQVLHARLLPRQTYLELLTYLGRRGCTSIAVFTEENIVCEGRNLACTSLEAIGEPATQHVVCLLDVADESIAKVLVAEGKPEELQRIKRYCTHHFASRLSITTTSSIFLEFMARGASKGAALLGVAGQMGIPYEAIASIGDSDNDLSMFEYTGLRIAVANATRAVLDSADWIVPAANEGGVAQAISRIIVHNTGRH